MAAGGRAFDIRPAAPRASLVPKQHRRIADSRAVVGFDIGMVDQPDTLMRMPKPPH
jgi:hypothetical protein